MENKSLPERLKEVANQLSRELKTLEKYLSDFSCFPETVKIECFVEDDNKYVLSWIHDKSKQSLHNRVVLTIYDCNDIISDERPLIEYPFPIRIRFRPFVFQLKTLIDKRAEEFLKSFENDIFGFDLRK